MNTTVAPFLHRFHEKDIAAVLERAIFYISWTVILWHHSLAFYRKKELFALRQTECSCLWFNWFNPPQNTPKRCGSIGFSTELDCMFTFSNICLAKVQALVANWFALILPSENNGLKRCLILTSLAFLWGEKDSVAKLTLHTSIPGCPKLVAPLNSSPQIFQWGQLDVRLLTWCNVTVTRWM